MSHPMPAAARVFTSFNTVFYADAASGEIRHGLFGQVPDNVTLHITDGTATLHAIDGGAARPVRCAAEGCRVIAASSEDGQAHGTTLQVVGVGIGAIALSDGGVFLCAESNGQVTLSRASCGDWEQFRAIATGGDETMPSRKTNFFVETDRANAVARIAHLARRVELPPFYILSPSYSPYAGGTVALHLLCHFLNRIGCEAYLNTTDVSGTLHTPFLAGEITQAHARAGRRPIGIYGEGYRDNRMICPRVVRYLLNVPGARWTDKNHDKDHEKDAAERFWRDPARRHEYILHYAEEFQLDYIRSAPLFIPIVDENIFHPPGEPAAREGFLVYSHRVVVTSDMIPAWARPYTMIEMASPRTPEQLGALYRRSRALIVFERTGAQLEAAMCGCAVVAIPNDGFTELPMFGRFGNLGVGWGGDQAQLEWSARTLPIFQTLYRAAANVFPDELARRVEEMMDFFSAVDTGTV
jgi:hypothetical protein